MRFAVDREKLAVICRNLARIVPASSPIADLTGILMEVDDSTGRLQLTAKNMEIAIRYECQAVVMEGGKMVLNAKLISEIAPMLVGERVVFTKQKNNTVLIQGGTARFHISCLPGTHYPKPELPEPESLVSLSGLQTLARQTAFAVKKSGKDKDADIYTNVRLEVYPTELRMIATDTVCLAIARHKQDSGGQAVMLIPAYALSALTGITGDDKVEVGAVKNTLVFKGADFVFTARTMAGVFLDVNNILKTLQPQYDALVPARELWNGVDSLQTVTDDHITPMRLALNKDGILLDYASDSSTFRTTVEAVVYRPTPAAGFCYGIHGLSQALRYVAGNLQIMIDKFGVLLLKNEDQCYLLTSVRPRKAAAKKQDKPAAKKNTAKTAMAKAA